MAFFSSLTETVSVLPRRPLLLAAGAAATAISIYQLIKRDDGEKRTADPEDPQHEDPVCDQATNPGLVLTREIYQDPMMQEAMKVITKLEKEKFDLIRQVKALQDRDPKSEDHRMMEVLKVSLAEAEEKHQKAEETITQLEKEKNDLMHQVNTLEETVEDLGNQLSEAILQCDKEMEAHRVLKSEHQEMMETLTNSEKSLQVSLAEAEEKHQKAVETISQLEEEKCNLTDQVNTLQEKMEVMENQLSYTYKWCDELMSECEDEQMAHSLLKSQHQEMMETLTSSEKSLKVSLVEAEEKHQKALETISQLEGQRSDLTDQVNTLQEKMEVMENQLSYTYKWCDELMSECEDEQMAHGLLKSQHQEMMEALTSSEKSLKVSLAEAEEKHQKAVETISQLEEEKCNLTDQVNTLQEKMEVMENQLSYTYKWCDELMSECEDEQMAHGLLKSQHQEMMEALTSSEKSLKVSLAEAEEKHQKALETISQLEDQRSDLTDQVNTLQEKMEVMENQLSYTYKWCDELMSECEDEQMAHGLLKSQHQEMMEALTSSEKSLKVSLAEAEEKHQKAEETITQLEKEKNDLMHQVNTLEETVEDVGNQLSEALLQCKEEKEAHRVLKSEHQERMETLTNIEKSLQAYMAAAEETDQIAKKTIRKLEEERSDLTDQVNTLRETVEDMGNQLFDTYSWCDKLKSDLENEQMAHSLLKSQHQEIMETLTNK